jgi:hypothetical protein
MLLRCAALLTILVLLAAAAPAAASERSEARRYAAAMQPEIAVTPEEGEALVADYEARSAHVAATCLPSVEAAAKKKDLRLLVALVYGFHASALAQQTQASWMAEADGRLAAITTRSRPLRRARAARRHRTAFVTGLGEVTPDFCAFLSAWEAEGFKGRPAGLEPVLRLFEEIDERRGADRQMRRARTVLKRHGATRAERAAFAGNPTWPELREPAPDPVAEALGYERESPDEGGTRTPSGAHAG